MKSTLTSRALHLSLFLSPFTSVDRETGILATADDGSDRIVRMSAFGPKRTSLAAPHMSAFGGKADISQIEEVDNFLNAYGQDS